MKNRIMTACVYLILCIIVPIISVGQYNKFTDSGNLFSQYKIPVIETKVYERLENELGTICIGCFFHTDTTGKITTRKFIPFTGVGNEFDASDSIWNSVISSLAKASEGWKFKQVLWELKDKATEVRLNKSAYQRPYSGRPNFFIIFEVSASGGSVIQKISHEKYFKVAE